MNLLPNGIIKAVEKYNSEIAKELYSSMYGGKPLIEKMNKNFCYKSKTSMDFDIDTYGELTCWFIVDKINPDWTINVNINDKLDTTYRYKFYLDHRKDDLLTEIRNEHDNYSLIYLKNDIPYFQISVYKFLESGYSRARLEFTWLKK